MFVKEKTFYKSSELDELGIVGIYTTQDFGDVMRLDKESILNKLSTDKKIVAGHQTHSDNIAIIDNLDKLYFEDTDGFITNRKDVLIFTKYADCLPIFIYDKKNKVMALVHSGWQGTFKEIGKKAINLMEQHYNTQKKDILVVFGIGICQNNYEVGKEFLEKFQEKFSKDILDYSFKIEDGKLLFDNQKFNYINLVKFGVDEKNIILNNLCTFEGEFHSYRRDREHSGRNGAFMYFK